MTRKELEQLVTRVEEKQRRKADILANIQVAAESLDKTPTLKALLEFLAEVRSFLKK